jgi:hypothetical protein
VQSTLEARQHPVDPNAIDLLMMIGADHYTVPTYIREARSAGVSKRIPSTSIPRDRARRVPSVPVAHVSHGCAGVPRCTEPYLSMIRCLQTFALGDASGAVGFIAAVWRLAGVLQPLKRSIVLPRLSAILMYSGLRLDATSLVSAIIE